MTVSTRALFNESLMLSNDGSYDALANRSLHLKQSEELPYENQS
jgi:hypothetical protein